MVSQHADLLSLAEERRRRQQEASAASAQAGRFVPTKKKEEKKKGSSPFSRFGDVARKVVPKGVRDITGAAARDVQRGYSRSQQASLGFFTGKTPGESVQQFVQGLRGEEQFSPEGLGFVRLTPEGSRERKVAAAAGQTLVDPVTLATVGFGPGIAGGLRAAGPAGRLAASLVAPVSGSSNAGVRLFSEVALGTGANLAGQYTESKDAPAPVVLASQLAGGALGLWTGNVLRGGSQTIVRDAKGMFTRNSAKAAAQEFGFNIGNRTFVPDLRPIADVRAEIRGATNEFEQTALGRATNVVVNPSKNYDSELGALHNAYTRQTTTGQQLAEVGVAAALDPHERLSALLGPGGTAGRLFDIDRKTGAVKNLRPKQANLSTHWSDVFSTVDAPRRYDMTPEQTAYWQDYRQALDEGDELLAANGLQRYKVKDNDKLYVPRVVRGVKGNEVTRPTNTRLSRLYEDAVDGVRAGIDYENDPRAVLHLYLQGVYKEVATQQFNDAMAPFLVSPKNVLNKTNPNVINDVVQAAKDLRDARKAARGERTAVIRERADVNKDILREAERGLRKNPDAGRGVEPIPQPPKVIDTADDIVVAQPTKPLPRSADAARKEIQESIAEARNFEQMLPNVTSKEGPAVTQATRDAVAAAQKKWNTAKAAYKRALDQTRNKELLPAYVFGNTQSDSLIPVGRWKGSFLPRTADYDKLAQQVDTLTGRPLPTRIDPFSRGMQDLGSAIRFTSAIGDLAMPLIHGLPLMGQNPVLWAKMAAKHYQGAIDPAVLGRYIRGHLESIQEMVQHGVPIADVEILSAATSGTGPLTRPISAAARTGVGKQTIGRFENALDTGLTVNRNILWESLKPHWDGTAEELAQYVKQMTGGLDSAANGVGATRRAWESVWMGFSPRLMRSTLALAVKAGNPSSPAGRQAARSLLGLAAFATGMAVTTNIAIGNHLGESEEQIWKRIEDTMNPLGGRKFLSIKIGDQYIGVGGQVRAIAQFVAKAVANPSGFATANQFDNPLINYYMGRGAVGVNIAGGFVEGATGGKVNVLPFESIDNISDAVGHAGTASFPFVIQAQLEAEGASNLDRATMGALGFLGGNVNQQTASQQIDDIANKVYGKPYTELSGVEQQRMEAQHADLFELKAREREEQSDRTQKQKRQALEEADTTRIDQERALADAYTHNLISAAQFRDEMKAIQRDAVVAKRTIRGDEDFKTTDANKLALSAWYDTFDRARIPGTEIVDWDVQEQLQADLFSHLTAGQQKFIDDRRVVPHDESVAWYFSNEDTIRESGYWAANDAAFARLKSRMPQGIETYSQLILAQSAAENSGNVRLAAQLRALKNAVDRISDTQQEALRRRDSSLDRALKQNGRTTKLLTRQAMTQTP